MSTLKINKEQKEISIQDCLGQSCSIRSDYFREANARQNLESQLQILKHENEEIKGAMTNLFGKISNLFSFFTGKLTKKIDNGSPLSFDDLTEVRQLSNTLSTDSSALQAITSLLDKYINNIKTRENFDCLQDLKVFDYTLSTDLRLIKNNKKTFSIDRKINALILYEYGRLLKLEGFRYIEGSLDYSEYIINTRRYAVAAGEAYSE